MFKKEKKSHFFLLGLKCFLVAQLMPGSEFRTASVPMFQLLRPLCQSRLHGTMYSGPCLVCTTQKSFAQWPVRSRGVSYGTRQARPPGPLAGH